MSASTTITLGGEEARVERVSARKASVALALLRALSKAAPEIQSDIARFRRDYETENVIELDRAQAQLRYPPLPLLRDDGEPLLDEHGQPRMVPSPLDRMTEGDWERAGHKLRLPRTPSGTETIAAVFDRALELAEDHVYRLLALFTMSNEDVARYRRDGTLTEVLGVRADELLDRAMADEALELAVVCGETIDRQFRAKATELGDRLGNALRLLGLNLPSRETRTREQPTPPPSNGGPSGSTPTSSTDSPAPTTDGPPTPSSTSPGTSSSSSSHGSEPTTTESEPSETPQPSTATTPVA